MNRLAPKILLTAATLLLLTFLAGPWTVRTYWRIHSSNPVRRGVQRARELGCFSCHGNLGSGGIKDPGAKDLEVPAWSGGLYMMYVSNDQDIRKMILYGSTPKVESAEAAHDHAERAKAAVAMPPFKEVLQGHDLEDLTAAFRILSRMSHAESGSSEARGMDLSRAWGCISCHGPGGSGGLSNPGSFTGFIPGWYGPDFQDMVRSREEFNSWVREGGIPRLARNPIASHFIRRQRIQMPLYRNLTSQELDDLWAYVRWLGRTGGGIRSR